MPLNSHQISAESTMSAKRDKHYLLVVTVLTGRNFPLRTNESLRIDVRFDGQLLSSLPVPLVEEPVFDTDMAFRLTGKQLKDHKIQRTPIKIEVNKINKKTNKPEKIGYQTLDLRTHAIEVGRPRFSWFQLLGSQAFRAKPEIHVGVSVDDDPDVEEVQLPTTPKEFTRSARVKQWNLNNPVLVNDRAGSYYQLGPSKDSTHLFLLTVTIGYASHLDRFFGHISPSKRPHQFFFHYELMTNHLTTKPFDDYQSADFASERVSIRIKSNVELLKNYFSSQRQLSVKLCHGDGHIIASTDLPFGNVFPPDSSDLTKPVLFEKELPLHPVADNRYSIPDASSDETPVIGIAVELTAQPIENIEFAKTLTLDSSQRFLSEIENLSNERPKSAKSAKPTVLAVSMPARSKSINSLNTRDDYENMSEITDSYREAGQPDVVSSGQFPRYLSATVHQIDSNFSEEEPLKKRNRNGQKTHAETQMSPEQDRRRDKETEFYPELKSSTTQTFPGYDPSPRMQSEISLSKETKRFVCTIFIHKIKVVSPNVRNPMTVYIRYQYPFFGSAQPIVIRPAFEVSPRMETILDGTTNLTLFTFGCSDEQLVRAFRAAPICMEVWRSGGKNQHDELIGQGKLRLDLLYKSETTTMYENDKPYLRRVFDTTIEVIELQSDKYPKLADLTICCTLDDHGPVQYQIVNSIESAAESGAGKAVALNGVPKSQRGTVEKLEKEAAVELEIWKEREEKKFRAQLKKKEEDVLKALADDWDKKRQEQNSMLQNEIQKARSLEEELRRLVLQHKKKEDGFVEREKRLNEADRFIRTEKSKLTAEIEDMEKKIFQDYSTRLELERTAQSLLKAEVNRLTNHTEDLQKRLAEKDEEIARLRANEKDKPFHQREMQAEIDRLALEKVDLERRAVCMNESKQHYKDEWAKANKEVAKLKDRLESEFEKRLQEKNREVENIRMQLDRAREQSSSSHRDAVPKGRSRRDQGENIVHQPQKQRLAMHFNGGSRGPAGDFSDPNDVIEEENEDYSDGNGSEDGSTAESTDEDDSHGNPTALLAKYIEERNVLLQIGIYGQGDTVITDLDRKIANLGYAPKYF